MLPGAVLALFTRCQYSGHREAEMRLLLFTDQRSSSAVFRALSDQGGQGTPADSYQMPLPWALLYSTH